MKPKGRILYTEDEPDCRHMIVVMLEQSGYQVTCVESGADALARAKTEPFDLFLVDNWMPGLSGPDLTRHIRELIRPRPSFSIPTLPMKMTNRPRLPQEHKAT